MTVVTKFDIGQIVYHTITAEKGVIVSIIIMDKGHTEYKVATGVATFGFLAEHEISLDPIYA